MATSPVTSFIRRVPRLFDRDGLGALTDTQLVQRFLAHRDDAAFAVLVGRHGPMVLGVARQLVREVHDADDIFQATFLLLARRADTLRRRQAVRGWLYQTTVNLARNQCLAAARRQAHERMTAREIMNDAEDSPTLDEFRAILHEELSRLPDRYRLPILLCHLEEQTHDEAAAALGWPVGTVRSRLSRGRELLRQRLSSRGVTGTALGLLVIASTAGSAVPSELVDCTIRSALTFAEGLAIPTVASRTAWAMAEEVLRLSAAGRFKLLATAMALVALCVAGTAGTSNRNEPRTDRALPRSPDRILPPISEPMLAQVVAAPVPPRNEVVEEVEIESAVETRWRPPPECLDLIARSSVRVHLETKLEVQEGKLWVDFSGWVGSDIHMWKLPPQERSQRFLIYSPPRGRSAVALAKGQITHAVSFFRLKLFDDRVIEERRTSGHDRYFPIRSYHISGDAGSRNPEKRIGIQVTLTPVRVMVRRSIQQ